jgi:hypothetical protein
LKLNSLYLICLIQTVTSGNIAIVTANSVKKIISLISSFGQRLGKLVVQVASDFEVLNALEVVLFLHDALVKLLLYHAILVLRPIQFLSGALYITLDVFLNVLEVMEQYFLRFFCSRLLVGVVDFNQVVLLLREEGLGVLHSVEQVEVLSVLIRLEV